MGEKGLSLEAAAPSNRLLEKPEARAAAWGRPDGGEALEERHRPRPLFPRRQVPPPTSADAGRSLVRPKIVSGGI